MFIRSLTDSDEIIAGDGTRLRELLHPERGYTFGGRYSLAHATVAAGEKSRPHKMKTSEVYFILSGEGKMHIGEKEAIVLAGDAFEIPAGEVQWIENDGAEPLSFLCIVDPAWQAADEEIAVF
jgi:mannose-6-phosphate isomerase-like protein (cupin superfamily)